LRKIVKYCLGKTKLIALKKIIYKLESSDSLKDIVFLSEEVLTDSIEKKQRKLQITTAKRRYNSELCSNSQRLQHSSLLYLQHWSNT